MHLLILELMYMMYVTNVTNSLVNCGAQEEGKASLVQADAG